MQLNTIAILNHEACFTTVFSEIIRHLCSWRICHALDEWKYLKLKLKSTWKT